MRDQIIIGVTDCSKYPIYSDWVMKQGPNVVALKLQADSPLEQCQGFVLTGGEDVHPRFYNKPEYLAYCYADDMKEERDAFEWKVLDYAEAHAVPVLGICRGLQIANVYFGGTLIPDIPAWGKFNHSKLPGGKDRYHKVEVDPDSWFHGIVGQDSGQVNSNHHQSADRIGNGLVASALSADGLPEALERTEPEGKAFLCLVQWHPERMENQESPFSAAVREAFIKAASQKKIYDDH